MRVNEAEQVINYLGPGVQGIVYVQVCTESVFSAGIPHLSSLFISKDY